MTHAPPLSGAQDCLQLRDVCLRLGGETLIGPLSLDVAPGEIVTLMGPSGCGKSSLLSYICGVLEPAFEASGEVILNDTAVTALPPERRRIGILFQDDLLFPHLSVAGNVAFGLRRDGTGKQARRALVDRALEDAGLGGFGDRHPATLSGGQRARVALLRTVLARPRALLLDEPFANLDAALRARFRQQVFRHTRDERLPTLLVTHDAQDAQGGDRVIELTPDH